MIEGWRSQHCLPLPQGQGVSLLHCPRTCQKAPLSWSPVLLGSPRQVWGSGQTLLASISKAGRLFLQLLILELLQHPLLASQLFYHLAHQFPALTSLLERPRFSKLLPDLRKMILTQGK